LKDIIMTFSLTANTGIWHLPLALLLVSSAAQVQAERDPADHAATSRLAYRSALENYQAYAAQTVQPWRASNDNVGRPGAHRADAGEVAPAGSAATGPAPAAGNDPHADHRASKP
jgi:hypothetical protein